LADLESHRQPVWSAILATAGLLVLTRVDDSQWSYEFKKKTLISTTVYIKT